MKVRYISNSLTKYLSFTAGHINTFVCCVMLILAPSKGVQADPQTPSNRKPASYTIPFRSLRKDDILIPVVINQKRFWFLLDTGSVLDIVLDSWAARLLHLAQKPPESPRLGGDYHESRGLLKSIKMLFQDTIRNNVEVTIAHLSDYTSGEHGKVAGIIGVPALKGRALTIDYLHKTLTFVKARSPLVAESPTVVLPMTGLPERYYVSVSTTSGRRADLCVDTGTDVTLLPPELVQDVPFTGVQSCVYTDGDGTESLTWRVLLSELSLGSLRETKVPAGIAAPDEVARLGSDMLSRFLVTMDFQNHQLLLRRAEDYAKRSISEAWIHAFIAKRQGRYYVDQVQTGLASENSGLHEGDRILKVGGRPISAAFFNELGNFAPGLEGRKVVLQVQHGRATPKQVVCYRRTGYMPLTRSKRGLFGYILSKKFHKPITVESHWGTVNFVPQMPLGSNILSIENVPVSPLSLSNFEPVLLRSKLRINIINPSGVKARIIVK